MKPRRKKEVCVETKVAALWKHSLHLKLKGEVSLSPPRQTHINDVNIQHFHKNCTQAFKVYRKRLA